MEAQKTELFARLDVVEAQRDSLVRELTNLDAQMRAGHRYQGGRRLSGTEFLVWRQKALARRDKITLALRDLKRELKRLRQDRNERVIAAHGLDVGDPDSLIAHAYNLLHRLASEGVELDKQEQAVINGLRHYLQHDTAEDA